MYIFYSDLTHRSVPGFRLLLRHVLPVLSSNDVGFEQPLQLVRNDIPLGGVFGPVVH